MGISFLVSELFIAFSILLLISFPLFLKSASYLSGNTSINLFLICKNFTLFVIFLSFFLILFNFNLLFYFTGYSFSFTNFTNFFKLLVLFCGFLIIYSINLNNNVQWDFPYKIFEIFPLFLFNILGILCFLSSETMLSAYISLELQSLTLALLLAFKYFSKYSSESGLKYFIISSFSTAILLLSFGFLYGIYGVITFEGLLYFSFLECSTNFIFLLSKNDAEQLLMLLSLFFIAISFFIKLGTVPFHMWTIDVYEGAPLIVTLYALVIPKIAYLGFLLKFFFFSFSNFSFLFCNLFFYTGIFSIIFGSLGALMQIKIKRLMAYSAIANFGYVMLTLSGGAFFNVIAAIIFLFIYVFVTCSIFFCIMSLQSRLDFVKAKSLFQLSVLANSGYSVISFYFVVFMFTIASIPPFNMYLAKYFLLYSLLLNNTLISLMGAVIVVLFSVVSCFYYIRFIRIIYFKSHTDFAFYVPFLKISYNFCLLISFLLILNLFFFFYPSFFFNILVFIILI